MIFWHIHRLNFLPNSYNSKYNYFQKPNSRSNYYHYLHLKMSRHSCPHIKLVNISFTNLKLLNERCTKDKLNSLLLLLALLRGAVNVRQQWMFCNWKRSRFVTDHRSGCNIKARAQRDGTVPPQSHKFDICHGINTRKGFYQIPFSYPVIGV